MKQGNGRSEQHLASNNEGTIMHLKVLIIVSGGMQQTDVNKHVNAVKQIGNKEIITARRNKMLL